VRRKADRSEARISRAGGVRAQKSHALRRKADRPPAATLA